MAMKTKTTRKTPRAAKKSAKSTSAPKPPRGWVDLGMVEPKPKSGAKSGAKAGTKLAEPPVEQQLQEFITEEVAGGFFNDATIVKLASDMYSDLAPRAKLRRLASPMLAAARAAHKREQRTWPKLTDNTRLDRAFAELEKHGILARQNFWCCSNCGTDALSHEVERGIKRGKKLTGYAFFHEQDTDMAVFGHGLHLDYGGPHIDDAGSVEIGKVVVKTLRKHGLKPKWAGDLDSRIHIPMQWRRKFTKQVKYTPT